MRAIYWPSLSEQELELPYSLKVDGEEASHLIKSARIRSGEQVLILTGNGLRYIGTVEDLGRRDLVLKVSKLLPVDTNSIQIDLAVGVVKKDAMDSVFKMSTELGIRNIFPLKTQYSQKDVGKEERIERLLVSALKQSNNPYLPNVQELTTIESLSYEDYDAIVFFNSQNESSKGNNLGKVKKVLVVIGPEGGLAESEISHLKSIKNIHEVTLNIPIMRTPTAVSCAVGYVLAT